MFDPTEWSWTEKAVIAIVVATIYGLTLWSLSHSQPYYLGSTP